VVVAINVASNGVLDDQELFDLQKFVSGDQNAIDTTVKVLQRGQLPEIMDTVASVLNEK